MFTPSSDRLKRLGEMHPNKIGELEELFNKKTNVYIDYANVRPWASKLGWHIDLKRLKQLLHAFGTIHEVKLYNGTLVGDAQSEEMMRKIVSLGYIVKTKPVKIMKLSIDVSSVALNSPDLLKNFIRKPLLEKLRIETVEALNSELKILNQQGILYVRDLKSNFDVEIGRDMLRDYDTDSLETFVLWSGDSDFADPVKQLLDDGKRVILFATARRVSSELNSLCSSGLLIFDIQKIKEFICFKKEMSTKVSPTQQKGPFTNP